MPRAFAIRHVAFEDLGILAPVLAARGFEISYVEAADGLAHVDAIAPDLLVILGGPIGVYEDEIYPFLTDELRLLEQRFAAGRPVLGICLGSQLLARAMGARVYSGGRKEIGWGPLELTDAGVQSPLRHLQGSDVRVLHWHGDTFDLPVGATLLASTEVYAHQAFAVGENVLGLQFHAEVEPSGLEHWFVGHACEIAAAPGISVSELRSDTARHAAATAALGRTMFDDWLACNRL